MTIKAIETRYAGCRFRSRLEARWAVFFDHLKIRWDFESQGFETPSGPYLPDFQLFDVGGDGREGLWFEVKPHDAPDDPRWAHVAEETFPLIVAYGMPRPDEDLVWGGGANGWMVVVGGLNGWDNGRAFCVCEVCGKIGITFEGRSGRVCGNHPGYADDYPTTEKHPRIKAAYTAARSARFEFGESG